MSKGLRWAMAGAATLASLCWHEPAAAADAPKTPAQPAEKAPALAEGVSAIVNDDVISTVDVRNRALFLLVSEQLPATAENLKRAAPVALRSLINERLELQEAKEYKLKVEPKDVDAVLEDIAGRQGLTVAGFEGELRGLGISMSTVRQQIEADIVWRRLISGRFGSRVRISREQVHDTMDRVMMNASKEQLQVSELTLSAKTPEEWEQAREGARQLLNEIQSTPKEQQQQLFGVAAQQFSTSTTAAAGGVLGWVATGDLRPEFEQALASAQPGQIVGPFETAEGVHLLGLWDRRAGVDMAAVTRLSLHEITAPRSERAALDRARKRIQGCENLSRSMNGVARAEIVPLGEVMQADLSQDMASKVQRLEPGQSSDVFDLDNAKVATLVVCNKDAVGEGLPTTDEVEDNLFEAELSLLSQRYLRNLRRDATIVTR